jgi:ABC-type transport system substrate-binding protein
MSMPGGTNYWAKGRLSRRTTLRGAGVGVAGLAGAALIGCGGGDDDPEEGGGAASTPMQNILGGGGTSTAAATVDANATAVPADQVRVAPGLYDVSVPPSAAEANPLVNGRYGGTLQTTYLDPPHMDINRTLSCTIYTTNNYTNNKVTRARGGAAANPFVIELEGDLAESWESNPDATQFTFHIRPGIKTHNVDPTTAASSIPRTSNSRWRSISRAVRRQTSTLRWPRSRRRTRTPWW